MKKLIKILGITLIAIIAIVIICAIIAPPIAKNYINKHGKELVGRKIYIDGLYSNLFTGYNRMTDFTLYEPDDSTSFVSFDTLVVDLSLYRLLANELRVNEITLVHPQVKVWQKGDVFNFNDLLALATSDTTKVASPKDTTESSPMTIAINNINLREGRVYYEDRVRKSIWDMEDMNLHIPGVYFSGENTNVGINLNFSNGGSLQTQTEYNLTNGDYLIHLNLQDLAIDNLQAYLTDYLNISKLSGLLSANMDIAGNVNHVLDLSVKGQTGLKNLSLSDTRDQKVLTLDTIGVDIQEINPSTNTFYFNTLAIKGFASSFDLYKDHNNLTDLMKESSADTTQSTTPADTVSEAPMHLRLNKLDISECAFTFNDHTLAKPFSFPMTHISVQADSVTLSGTNHIRMKMNMGKGGNAFLNWKGKLDDISNLMLTLSIKNVDLQSFDPYCLEYFAYPIRKGVLAFTSVNVITNNMLEGRNTLDAFRFELENKRKELKPEYNIPMKTALYLIKDKNDKINMELPVKGNITSPEFSYRKLIFKTLTNLLVKIAVSPITFMANSMGLSPDKLQAIPLDPSQWDFTSEQFSTLNDLAAIVKDKPAMTLVLEQGINLPQAREELAMFNAKKKYYLSQHPEKSDSTLLAIDYVKMQEIETRDEGFNTYITGIVAPEHQTENITEKVLTLVPAETLQAQVDRFMTLRNQKATSYLISQGVPAANLRVETLKPEVLNTYNGKSQYKIDLVLPEDEQSKEAIEQ